MVAPGKNGQLLGEQGETLTPPAGWAFLAAGDAGVTRKVTATGAYWRVQFKKGRKTISMGVWAPAEVIGAARQAVAEVRETEQYQKKRVSDLKRREKKQSAYEGEFFEAVLSYLGFHPNYSLQAKEMARLITEHTTPVGSGTVARTQRIPLEERAGAAVIAWMRHQTTAYDKMQIARIKGERRAVRRSLAQQSVNLLEKYRKGLPLSENCPLLSALKIDSLERNDKSNPFNSNQ